MIKRFLILLVTGCSILSGTAGTNTTIALDPFNTLINFSDTNYFKTNISGKLTWNTNNPAFSNLVQAIVPSTFTNSATIYVDTNGNDTTFIVGSRNLPAKSLGIAISNCPLNGVVYLSSGQAFPVPQRIVFTTNCTIQGNSASVYSTGTGIFRLDNSYQRFYNLTLNDVNQTAILGLNSAGSQGTSIWYNCFLNGRVDVVHTGVASNNFHFAMYGGKITSAWDTFRIDSVTNDNVAWEFYNTIFDLNTNYNPAVTAGAPNAGSFKGGYVRYDNCLIISTTFQAIATANVGMHPGDNCVEDIINTKIIVPNNVNQLAIWADGSNTVVNIYGSPCRISDVVFTNGSIINFSNQFIGNLYGKLQDTNQDLSGTSVKLNVTSGLTYNGTNITLLNTNTLYTANAGSAQVANKVWTNNGAGAWLCTAASARFITNAAANFWEIFSGGFIYTNGSPIGQYSIVSASSPAPVVSYGSYLAPFTTPLTGYVLTNGQTAPIVSGTVYSGPSLGGKIEGDALLNAVVASSANITLFLTNNLVGEQHVMQIGSGVIQSDSLPFSYTLSTNSTFQFVYTMGAGATGYVTNFNLKTIVSP